MRFFDKLLSRIDDASLRVPLLFADYNMKDYLAIIRKGIGIQAL